MSHALPIERNAETTATEQLGRVTGAILAPIVGLIARMRRARMFHPEGVVYLGRMEQTASVADLKQVGERLAGDAIVRLSSAWWRAREWPDVLGIAVRLIELG